MVVLIFFKFNMEEGKKIQNFMLHERFAEEPNELYCH